MAGRVSAVAAEEDSDPFGPGSMFEGSDPAKVCDPFGPDSIFGDIDPSKVAGPFLEPGELDRSSSVGESLPARLGGSLSGVPPEPPEPFEPEEPAVGDETGY